VPQNIVLRYEMNKLISSTVIAQNGVTFGTSGARGLVTQFTPDVCAAFTIAFIKSLKSDFDCVAIAIDNRPSSYAMAQACSSALKQLNLNVIYYGVLPTPALAYAAQEDAMPGIMVTGSHIPFDRNGLKFYRPDGEISKDDEQAIITDPIEFFPLNELNELIASPHAAQEYISRYTSLFDTMWLTGKRIGIYEHSSAGRDLYYKIFEAFGAKVIRLERTEHFVPIDTEAVSVEDTLKAINWSKEHNLDLIFSTDGDGDRPLVYDQKGNGLRGDILGLLTAEQLNIQALAIPVSCNTSVELSEKFIHVKRTKIGSPYVIAAFESLTRKFKAVAGFEANGGFLLASNVIVNAKELKALPTRDAVLPVIMILASAQSDSISNRVAKLPARYTHSDRIQNFSITKSQAMIAQGKKEPRELLQQLGFTHAKIKEVDETDGLRIALKDGLIIHLRSSGNAPELRCYAEADTVEIAQDVVQQVLTKIKNI